MEGLEDRDCPSTFVNSAAGGNWTAIASWTRTGGAGGPGWPIGGDAVTISGAGGNITNNSATGALASLTITGAELDDNSSVVADSFSMSGGKLVEAGVTDVGQLTMTGGEIDANATTPGTVEVDIALGSGSHDSSWTGGTIGGTTTKGTFECEPNLTFGQNVSTLGFDMQLGYGASGSTNTYQAATTTLNLTNDASIYINSGSTLNLTEAGTGSNAAGRTFSSSGTVSYVSVNGTLNDQIVAPPATTKVFKMLPIYVGSVGELDVDGGTTTNAAYLYVPTQTAGTSPATYGYGIYQDGGSVILGLGGTGTAPATLQANYGYYQNAGTLSSTGPGGAFVGGAAKGNGLYVNNRLVLDPTQSATLWGSLIVSGCELKFGASSTFEFCVNAAVGGSYSHLIVGKDAGGAGGQVTVASGATYAPHLLGTGTETSWTQVIDFTTLGGGSWATGSSNFTDPVGWQGSQNAGGWDLKKK